MEGARQMAFWRKAEVEIVPERPIYLPGEIVNVRVRIRGTGTLELEEARVELRRSQHYSYERRVRDNDGDYRWTHNREVEHTAVGIARVLGKGTLQEGAFFEQFVALRLPDSADPTGDAGLIDTGWSVQLVLNRRRAIDVTAGASITVLAPHTLSADRIATDVRGYKADECEVVPHLPSRNVRAGEVLQGFLLVLARTSFEARRVRVDLVRVEKTEGGPASYTTRGRNDSTTIFEQPIAGGGTLPVGVPWNFPFAVAIPPQLHPTAFTVRGDVRWLLRGVIDRSFASDYWGEVEVNVYNGPPEPAPEAGAVAAALDSSSDPEGPDEDRTSLPPGTPASPPPSDVPLVLAGGDDGPLAGQTFGLDAPLVTLGRSETNTIVVPEGTVSRAHAAIRREGGAYFLRDVGSTGGTYVNSEPLAGEHALRDGDVIGLGAVVTLAVRAQP